MKKLLFLVGVATLFLSGCASKSIIISGEMKVQEKDENSKIFKVAAANMTDSTYMGTTHVVKNIEHKFLIESDAEVVLENGYRYFTIIKPINTSDEMITSAEELHKTCFDKGIGSSFYDSGKQCSFHEDLLHYANIIVAFKKRPTNVLTIDAQEVISYLKDNDMYVEQKNFKMLELQDKFLEK